MESSEVNLELPESASVAVLRHALVDCYPQLKTLAPVLLVAINARYAADDQILAANDEIACFPPVSGG